MTLEPIGYLVFMVGVIAFFRGSHLAITALCFMTLLGAAAALQLPALGGGSIQPSHLMVLFLALTVLRRPNEIQASIRSLAPPAAGFWFAFYVLFSVASAIFLPRIFAGATLVYSSARDSLGNISTIAMPLAPGSSNITQAVYLLGGLACFAMISGFTLLGHAEFIARRLIATAALCFLFAAIDASTFFIGYPEFLDFIRNANYTMHTAETLGGFKRIVGSFPEASAYSSVALVFFVFTLMLWLDKYPSRWVGPLSLLLGISIIMSTSTTAYAASVVMFTLIVIVCLKQTITGGTVGRHAPFLMVMLVGIPCLIMALMLLPDVWNAISGLVDIAVSDKMQSQSGEERTSWNRLSLISFLETSTFGGGLGTVRASSFLFALLSNVGLIGTLLFTIFFYSMVKLYWKPSKTISSQHRAIGMAAIMACISQVVSATVSGSSTDLGLLFSIMAALAIGCLSPAFAPVSRQLEMGVFYPFPNMSAKTPIGPVA
ncbi:hypothetical protein [Agrobacterium sp.]|uniref:hypothetical protein n=1 Tax=Agrobacterium sp. TaxID=361 RepID=UPI0028B0C1FC|nr:hypothetical protein [Agrobacterium sp.]